jgi:hypothetical protein
LYTETSENGESIFLTLNKTVTSPVENINLLILHVTINNSPVEINSIHLSENNQYTIEIKFTEPLFYGGAIKLSYQGNTIFNENDALDSFFKCCCGKQTSCEI